jgi:hypothetical protein
VESLSSYNTFKETFTVSVICIRLVGSQVLFIHISVSPLCELLISLKYIIHSFLHLYITKYLLSTSSHLTFSTRRILGVGSLIASSCANNKHRTFSHCKVASRSVEMPKPPSTSINSPGRQARESDCAKLHSTSRTEIVITQLLKDHHLIGDFFFIGHRRTKRWFGHRVLSAFCQMKMSLQYTTLDNNGRTIHCYSTSQPNDRTGCITLSSRCMIFEASSLL